MTRLLSPRSQVAAFFDLDGTIIPGPSLERRLFRSLRKQRAISTVNYFFWLAQAARLAPYGVSVVAHANKTYLRDISVTDIGIRIPSVFPDALDRIAWHAGQGHAVFLVSGTVAPLARAAALTLILRLALCGSIAEIGVCSTQLEEVRGRSTGRILGEPVFAQGKARAICRLARQAGFDLTRCYAYGDSANDRWMLGAVGNPAAVNPSRELERIARLLEWPVLGWNTQSDEKQDTPASVALGNTKLEIPG